MDAKDAETGEVPVIDTQGTLVLARMVEADHQIGDAAGADLRWRSFAIESHIDTMLLEKQAEM
jgi:hypothetical protein